MSKPRIKVGIPHYGNRTWMCFSSDGSGLGDTPWLAYEAWLRYVRFYGPRA